jgi:hypothetical protein
MEQSVRVSSRELNHKNGYQLVTYTEKLKEMFTMPLSVRQTLLKKYIFFYCDHIWIRSATLKYNYTVQFSREVAR